ncbi:seminal fluid protein CSSFP029, partial [Danaus plexippus plexippus]
MYKYIFYFSLFLCHG